MSYTLTSSQEGEHTSTNVNRSTWIVLKITSSAFICLCICINAKSTVYKRQMIWWIKTFSATELGGNGHLTRTMIVYKK